MSSNDSTAKEQSFLFNVNKIFLVIHLLMLDRCNVFSFFHGLCGPQEEKKESCCHSALLCICYCSDYSLYA